MTAILVIFKEYRDCASRRVGFVGNSLKGSQIEKHRIAIQFSFTTQKKKDKPCVVFLVNILFVKMFDATDYFILFTIYQRI